MRSRRPLLRHLIAWVCITTLAHGAVACEPATFRLAVDIGHTSSNPGAISARGLTERDYNGALGAHIAAALHDAGFTSQLIIAGDDVPIDLAERARLANEWAAQLLISVHHDSVQPQYLKSWTVDGKDLDYTDHAKGYSLFVSTTNGQYAVSLKLAMALGEALRAAGFRPSSHHAEPVKGENRRFINAELGIYQFEDLAILRLARMPAVLLEAGVIKNRDEELLLGTDAFRERTANAVVAAVERICGLGPQ